MHTLYYYPLNASMAPHFMLEALGAPYALTLVDRKSDAQKSSDYLRLNPAGRIPTLIDGDLPIFESAAICVHLAEKHPESGLIPALGSKERPLFFQWMMYLTNTLQADLMVYFYPQKHTVDTLQTKEIVTAQVSRIKDSLSLLDSILSNQTFLLGDNISACDYFLFMLAVWADEIDKPPLAFEHLGNYLRNMATRREIIAVCQKENLSLKDYQ